MDLNKIKLFVKDKHEGQKRKQGTPYYEHPFAVANMLAKKGFNEEYQAIALLHDILEDTDATEDEVLKLTNEKVLQAVKLLTKEENYNMNDYVNKIKENDLAKMVKLADRIHNLSEAHYASLEFVLKYISETKTWYVDLSLNTPFEKDLSDILIKLEDAQRDEF